MTTPERIAYGSHPLQYGLLHRAEGASRGTAVFIHGGFWRYKPEFMSNRIAFSATLAGLGWDVWQPEYRADGGDGAWPATIDDVGAAIDHLAVLQETHGIDASAPVVLGHSAGGHLAVWTTTRDGARVPVRAAISLAGALDLRLAEADDLGEGAASGFIGGTSAEFPERFAAADPARRVVPGARVRIIHGDADDVVPVSQAHAYVAAAHAVGQDVALEVVPGDHDVVVDADDPSFALLRAAMEELAAR